MKPKNNYCIVPMCTSTSRNNPNKEFIIVPRDLERRKIWLETIRRKPGDISDKTTAYVCEDHFQLEDDLENYMEFKMMGTKKRLKSHVIPHKFDCQIFKAPKPAKRKRLNVVRSPSKVKYYIYICPKPTVNHSITIKLTEPPQIITDIQVEINDKIPDIEEIVIKSEPIEDDSHKHQNLPQSDEEPHFETVKVEPYCYDDTYLSEDFLNESYNSILNHK